MALTWGGRAGVHGGGSPKAPPYPIQASLLGFTFCNRAMLTSISRWHKALGTFGEGTSPSYPQFGHLGQCRSAFGNPMCLWRAKWLQTGCAGPWVGSFCFPPTEDMSRLFLLDELSSDV